MHDLRGQHHKTLPEDALHAQTRSNCRDEELGKAAMETRALSYTPLIIRKEIQKGGAFIESKLRTVAEGPIPAGNALHEFKKSCAGRLELLGCVTMYNEDFNLFRDTMAGFMRNYAELLEVNEARYKGRVAVVCIADGFAKLNEEFLQGMTDHGLFDRKYLVQAGCFEKVTNHDGSKSEKLREFVDMGVLRA